MIRELTPQYIIEQCETYDAQCKLDGCNMTLTGLALHVGANSLDHLYELMSMDEEVAASLKRAILKVEYTYERFLMFKETTSGAQFVLAKMGWVKKDNAINITNKLDINGVNYAELPDQELVSLLNVIKGKELAIEKTVAKAIDHERTE